MTTTQIALGLAHLTAAQTADQLDSVGKAMGAPPQQQTFASPPIAPTALMTKGAAIRAALQAQRDANLAAQLATKKLHDLVMSGHGDLTAQSHYVASVAKGDGTLVTSAGFSLKGKAVHSHTLATPTGLSAALADHPHAVSIHFHGRASVHGGGSAVHEIRCETTTDPSKVDSWALASSTSGNHLVVENLPTGAHSFRLIAVGADHLSAPSGVVTIYVP